MMTSISGGRDWIRLSMAAIVAVAMLFAAAPMAMAGDAEDAQGTVDKALVTFNGMKRTRISSGCTSTCRKRRGC